MVSFHLRDRFSKTTLIQEWVERTYECLKAAYDAGINFFDTAEGYEGGKSETIMGKAIKRFGWKQQDLVISTKVSSAPKTHLLGISHEEFKANAGNRSIGARQTAAVKKHSTTRVCPASTSLKASIFPFSVYNFHMSMSCTLTGPTD